MQMVAESPTESTAGAVISDAARAAVATVSALPHVPAIAWVLAARLAAAAYAGYVLSYIILFGFQHAGHEVASFVLAWLGSEALSLLLIDPAAHLLRVVWAFSAVPSLVGWFARVGLQIFLSDLQSDLTSGSGDSALSTRFQNAVFIECVARCSILAPEVAFVAHDIGALSTVLFKQGQENESDDEGGTTTAAPRRLESAPEAVLREREGGALRQQSQGEPVAVVEFEAPAAHFATNPMAVTASNAVPLVRGASVADEISAQPPLTDSAAAAAVDIVPAADAVAPELTGRPQVVTDGGAPKEGAQPMASSWRKRLQARDVRAALIDELYRAAVATGGGARSDHLVKSRRGLRPADSGLSSGGTAALSDGVGPVTVVRVMDEASSLRAGSPSATF